MASRSQPGPNESDSGMARRRPPTAIRARAAGQRGSARGRAGVDVGVTETGFRKREAKLEVLQVVEHLGVSPIHRADDFAADDTLAVDDVAFRWAVGAESVAGMICDVIDGGDAPEIVIDKILAIGGLVGLEGDGEDDDVGHVFLELDEGWKLLEAGAAPTGPEIKDNDFAAVLSEADGLRTVVDDDVRGAISDGAGTGRAVAGREHRAESAEHSDPQDGMNAEAACGKPWTVCGMPHVSIIVGSSTCGPTIKPETLRNYPRT